MPYTTLHLFVGSVPGGVLRYVVDIAAATRAAGETLVLAGQRGDWHPLVEESHLDWVEIPIRGGLMDMWRSSRVVRRLVRERGIDVIHAHHRRATLVARMARGQKAESRKQKAESGGGRVPLLYTLHLTGMPMGFPWRWLSDFGDHCHAPSIAAKRWLMDIGRVPESRISVIPHGIRPERWPVAKPEQRLAARIAMGLPSEGLVGAFVGRLEDPKNEAWVLDLAGECRRRGIGVKWLMAGDGPNREAFESRLGEMGLEGVVKVLGERDPLGVYHAADLLVLPSAREGFGYSCAEAMCCGVPVLRTRTAGTDEMVVEGVTGRSCEIDKAAFVRAGVEMLEAGDALREMGRAAAEHVRRQLSFQRQLDETLRLYERLARGER